MQYIVSSKNNLLSMQQHCRGFSDANFLPWINSKCSIHYLLIGTGSVTVMLVLSLKLAFEKALQWKFKGGILYLVFDLGPSSIVRANYAALLVSLHWPRFRLGQVPCSWLCLRSGQLSSSVIPLSSHVSSSAGRQIGKREPRFRKCSLCLGPRSFLAELKHMRRK